MLAVLQWLLQCTHHLQLLQNSLGNSGAFQLSESGPQGLVRCFKSRPQVTQIEGTKLLTEGRPSKSDGLSKNCFVLRKEVGEGEGRAHFRATQEPFMWVVAI